MSGIMIWFATPFQMWNAFMLVHHDVYRMSVGAEQVRVDELSDLPW